MLFLLLLSFFNCIITTQSYVYPLRNKHSLFEPFYYMHQKQNRITFCTFTKNEYKSLLAPWYNPAYVRFSLHKKCFSFIDNGRIYIKQLKGRSASVLELSIPLYHIQSVDWITNDILQVNSDYKNNFGIFFITTKGIIIKAILKEGFDLLFPQIYEKKIYYIAHTIKNNISLYSIGIYNKNKFIDIILPQNDILSFLHMCNDKEGFVLSYKDDNTNNMYLFSINHFFLKIDKWYMKKICSFTVPKKLFDLKNNNCLFEGMLSLLPVYINKHIYYIDIKNEINGFTFLHIKHSLEKNSSEVISFKSFKDNFLDA